MPPSARFAPVHQFCRIGRYAYIGSEHRDYPGCAAIFQSGHRARDSLSRRERNRPASARASTPSASKTSNSAYRLLLRSKLNTSQAVEQMRETLDGSPDVSELIAFIESADRGLTK